MMSTTTPCCVALPREPRERIARELIAAVCRKIHIAAANPELAGWTRPAQVGDEFFGAYACADLQLLFGVDSVDKLLAEIWRVAEDHVSKLIEHEMTIGVGSDGVDDIIVLEFRPDDFYAGN